MTDYPLLCRVLCRALLLSTVAITAAAGCSGASGGGLPPGYEPCRPAGVEGEALCGTVRVFENRQAQHGRTLDLQVVVLPAQGRREPDPLFYLEGGPGAAATPRAPGLSRSPLRRNRDIVLVDQRGTGGSNPLRCDLGGLEDTLRAALGFEVPDLAPCLEGLAADPRFYTTTVAAGDLEDVRRALGYEEINLWGTSYGTRLALEVLRRYPEHVRTAVLHGVAPPSLQPHLTAARTSQTALEATFDACAAEPACRAAYPDLRRDLERALDGLAASPAVVTVPHPTTREPWEIPWTRDMFAGTLRFMLYDARTASRIPAVLHAAAAGDHRPAAEFAARFIPRLAARFHFGMTLSVMCSEDAPYFTVADAERAAAGSFLGAALGTNLLSVCEGWPKGPVPEDFTEPVRSEVPVLLLSGAVDPITPPAHAEAAVRYLTKSRHVILPATAHAGAAPDCVNGLMQEFLDTGGSRELDLSCTETLQRPGFEISRLMRGSARDNE